MGTMRVATYCRISDDRDGQALGVRRQAEDCDALAEARGWSIAGRFVDNDISAYSGKPRPGYAQLLDAVRGGTVDGIVAWHPDRLHRSPRELEDFLSLVEKHGVIVETVRAGKWDLSTPSGRLTARILGSVARGESEQKSDRVRRALEQRAQMGRAHGKVAYGWTRATLPDGSKVEAIDEDEAAVVRDVAQRIVRGESLRGIVADLDARGISSPTGKPWGKTMLRHIVTRERNVSLRLHRGVVVGAGDWPPLLDRALWEHVRAVLADPARKTSTSSAAKHLLSGIATCGVCGAAVRASMNRSVPSYKCSAKSCVSRNRADVDNLITGVITGRLARPDAADLLAPKNDAVRDALVEMGELRGRLDAAADDYADAKIDRAQLQRITDRLRPKLEAAEARARTVDASPLLADIITAADVAAAWDAMPLTRQRAIVDTLVTVKILRSVPGARVFDPESIEVTWR